MVETVLEYVDSKLSKLLYLSTSIWNRDNPQYFHLSCKIAFKFLQLRDHKNISKSICTLNTTKGRRTLACLFELDGRHFSDVSSLF